MTTPTGGYDGDRQGTGQGSPDGDQRHGGGGHVRHRSQGDQVVRALDVAGREADLSPVREHRGGVPDREREAHAVSVPGLPEVLQPQDRDPDGEVPASPAGVGLGDLHGADESQGRLQHEAAPGPWGDPEDRMVHAPPDPGGFRGRADGVRRARRSRRDLCRRAAEEHVHGQAGGTDGPGAGGQAGRGGDEGPGDGPRRGQGDRQH